MTSKEVRLRLIRQAVADYMLSEGCGCCERWPDHDNARRQLATLLDVPLFDDGSGYDFNRFATEPLKIGGQQ